MKRHTILLVVLITALMLACNLQTAVTPDALDEPQTNPDVANPTDTPTTEIIVQVPTNTPTITLSPTPSVPMVSPKADAVNCRYGPGTAYIILGGLAVGSSVPIIGKTADAAFWLINTPGVSGQTCFVAASVTNATGNLSAVPVVDIPISLLTNVTMNPPANISVAGCMGPIPPMALKGTIEVNGPMSVVWHFETQQGGALPNHTTVFTGFGSQEVTDNTYTPPLVPGTYWAKLVVTSPVSLTGTANYNIACP